MVPSFEITSDTHAWWRGGVTTLLAAALVGVVAGIGMLLGGEGSAFLVLVPLMVVVLIGLPISLIPLAVWWRARSVTYRVTPEEVSAFRRGKLVKAVPATGIVHIGFTELLTWGAMARRVLGWTVEPTRLAVITRDGDGRFDGESYTQLPLIIIWGKDRLLETEEAMRSILGLSSLRQ